MQARVRLKVSGDKNELRQSYVPTLYSHLVQPLMDNGAVSTFGFHTSAEVCLIRLPKFGAECRG